MGDRPASPMDAYDSRPSDRGDIDRHSRSRSRSPKYERRSASRSRSPPRRYSADRRPRNRSRSRSRSRSPSRSRDQRSSKRRSVSPRRRSRSPRYRRRSPARRENKEFHGTREAPEMSNILGVFGLSLRTREEDLEDEFRKFGTIEKVTIVYDHRTDRSRGFGFVYFQDQEDATRARDAMNGKDIDGRKIRVDYSVTHRPHTPTPGQYMGERRPNYYDRDRRFRDRRNRRSRSRSFDRRRRYYRSRSRSRSWSR